MIGAWIAGAAVVGFIMLISSNVKIRFKLFRDKKDDEITVDVKAIYGLLRKRVEIPVITFINFQEGLGIKTKYVDKAENQLLQDMKKTITKRTIKEAFDNFQQLLAHCFQFNQWLIGTLSHVYCTRLYWKTDVGVGDAAETALTTGMVWGLKTSMLGFLFRFIKLEAQPELKVIPQFNGVTFYTEITCSARIRLIYMLAAGVRLIYRIIKVKGGLKTWRRVLLKAKPEQQI